MNKYLNILHEFIGITWVENIKLDSSNCKCNYFNKIILQIRRFSISCLVTINTHLAFRSSQSVWVYNCVFSFNHSTSDSKCSSLTWLHLSRTPSGYKWNARSLYSCCYIMLSFWQFVQQWQTLNSLFQQHILNAYELQVKTSCLTSTCLEKVLGISLLIALYKLSLHSNWISLCKYNIEGLSKSTKLIRIKIESVYKHNQFKISTSTQFNWNM